MANELTTARQLTRDEALLMAQTEWWNEADARTIAGFQLFQDRLACDFAVFHEAVEQALGRQVWTHEFGLNVEGLRAEFLGKKAAPTLDDILALIPEEKRIVLQVSSAPGAAGGA